MINITYKPISTHITRSKNRKIEYIVVHYTAGSKSTDGAALATRNVFLKRQASADFVVDDKNIIQINPDLKNYYCWAVGDGKGKYGVTNKNSVSIEICSTLKKGTSASVPNHAGWSFSEDVIKNTVELVRYLMKLLNIDVTRVIRHYDASRKSCPGILGWNNGTIYNIDGTKTDKKNDSIEWWKFRKMIVDDE